MYVYRATVERVVDGDTLDLNISLGFKVHVHERVRLIGVDTPETYGVKKESQEYQDGMKAKARVEELVLGQEVTIKTQKDKTGKYGRYLAEIFYGDSGVSLGETLLIEGLAKPM